MKQQTHNSGVFPWILLAVPVLWLSAILAYLRGQIDQNAAEKTDARREIQHLVGGVPM